jgi:ABC-type sugar transport system ATPase subunit
MNETILEMKGISKYIFDSYGVALRGTTEKILDKVDFDLKKGEVHILVGENGAGKSTLMKVLGGIIPPDEGQMVLDGAPVAPRNPREAQAKGIGFIHQELNLCDNLSVADNIFMGREIKAGVLKDASAMRERASCLLKDMGIDIDPAALVRNLSTAQQQLVEIVKVLSKNCRIIIMDEPTSSLTKSEIDILFKLIRKLRESGVAIIYISHRLSSSVFCDKVLILDGGKVVDFAPHAELMKKENSLYYQMFSTQAKNYQI